MQNKNLMIDPGGLHAPLSKNIVVSYNTLVTVVLKVPPSQLHMKLLDGTSGKISVADSIAYQIGWGTLLLSWYEAGLKNQDPIMPGHGFATWNYKELAQVFYVDYHYDGRAEQLKALYQLVVRLVAMTEKEHIAGHLEKLGIWRWCTLKSGVKWPLSKWITVNTVAPYKRASLLIQRIAIQGN